MGHSQSQLSFQQAADRIEPERMAQYLDGFKRMAGSHGTEVTLAEYQANFVRPSVSAPVSRRVFRALVGFRGHDDAKTPPLNVQDFVRGAVSLCDADAEARMHFAFQMFADGSGKTIDLRSFVSLWAPTMMLARTLGFKLRASPSDHPSMLDLVNAGQKHFHDMTQKNPEALMFRDFAIWSDHGNNEVVRFLAWAVIKSAIPDYKLPAGDLLSPLLSGEAKVVGGECELLTQRQLDQVCSFMPHEIAPPGGALLPFYATSRNGFSMTTLIALHEKNVKNKKVMHTGVLLIAKTTEGETFGAFVSSPLKLRIDHAHGDAKECFIFSAHEKPDEASPAFVRVYSARDAKHTLPCLYYIEDADLPGGYGIGIGGRDGYYGIVFDGSLTGGVTNVTSTFGGEPLVTANSEGKFKIASLEAFAPTFPVDETREPIFKVEKEKGVLEKGAEAMFILDLIGQGYSQSLS